MIVVGLLPLNALISQREISLGSSPPLPNGNTLRTALRSPVNAITLPQGIGKGRGQEHSRPREHHALGRESCAEVRGWSQSFHERNQHLIRQTGCAPVSIQHFHRVGGGIGETAKAEIERQNVGIGSGQLLPARRVRAGEIRRRYISKRRSAFFESGIETPADSRLP